MMVVSMTQPLSLFVVNSVASFHTPGKARGGLGEAMISIDTRRASVAP